MAIRKLRRCFCGVLAALLFAALAVVPTTPAGALTSGPKPAQIVGGYLFKTYMNKAGTLLANKDPEMMVAVNAAFDQIVESNVDNIDVSNPKARVCKINFVSLRSSAPADPTGEALTYLLVATLVRSTVRSAMAQSPVPLHPAVSEDAQDTMALVAVHDTLKKLGLPLAALEPFCDTVESRMRGAGQ